MIYEIVARSYKKRDGLRKARKACMRKVKRIPFWFFFFEPV